MRLAVVGLLLALSGISPVVPTIAGPSYSPNLSITVAPGTVSVVITLTMQQNLTAFTSTFSLPQFHGVLDGPNATMATQTLQFAIASKNSLARVEGLRLEALTSAWSNTTNVQWLNITMNFQVTGVSNTRSGVPNVDLSWKSFSVTSDVALNGFEVNNIGAKDLQPIAHTLAQEKGSQFVSFSYRINDSAIALGFFADSVARINSMNFSRLGAPVAQWKQAYVPLASTIAWKSPQTSLLGLRFIRTISLEPTTPTTDVFGLFYALQAQVTVPAGSSVSGDTVILATNGLPETLMGITITSSIVLGSGAFLYEKRLSPSKAKPYSGRRRTRR